MALGDLAGIGQLRDALTVTNRNLELVLAELKETNGQRLEAINSELQRVNASLETLLRDGLLTRS
jgi:hypothetical protein